MVIIKKLNKELLVICINEFIEIDKNIPFEPTWTQDNFMVDLPGKWEYSFIAINGVRVVGFSIASVKKIDGKACGYLHRIAISLEFQNKGIGRRLMKALEESLKEAKIELLLCSTKEKNLFAQTFYNNLGYIKRGIRTIGDDKWIVYQKEVIEV